MTGLTPKMKQEERLVYNIFEIFYGNNKLNNGEIATKIHISRFQESGVELH